MSLAAELLRVARTSASAATPVRQRVLERGIALRRDLAIQRHALAVGEMTPEFALASNRGRIVTLDGLLDQGPAVLVFYRGSWCPYCRITLASYQRALAALSETDGTLVAISPETPSEAAATAAALGLSFDVLSDLGSRTAATFGILYDMTDDAIALCMADGIDLPRLNGDPRWVLPLPATYVVGCDGVARYAFVDPDYRHRAEPDDVIDALRRIRAKQERHS
ncbi:MAG: peroxiredoxin-like family protein [Alphaproteobacteria bacterium]